jgi:hypothetical protein
MMHGLFSIGGGTWQSQNRAWEVEGRENAVIADAAEIAGDADKAD